MMSWIGQRTQRVAVMVAASAVASSAAAQPKHERQVFSRVMELRGELHELAGAEPETVAAVAEMLSSPNGDPVLVLERVLAKVRHVDADPAFLLRGGLMLFAMPEVVDGDRYDAVHLTVHAPYRRETPGDVALHLRVLDPAGEERWKGVIEEQTAMEDLLRYRATTTAAVEGWPDGCYRAELEVWIDGEPPRPTDPRIHTRFCVLRDFATRVEKLIERVNTLDLPTMAPAALAAKGALSPLVRIYQGEPPEGDADPLRDLEIATRVVANAEAKEPPLAGLEGWVTVAVPTGDDEAAPVAVRLAAQEVDPQRPLVVFVPGVPAWDAAWDRPTSPVATPAGWLRDAVRISGFDRDQQWQLVVMPSPGEYHDAMTALQTAVPALRDLLDARGPVVLVGEREGAGAITAAIAREPSLAKAVVLVAGGVLDPRAAASAKAVAVLAVPALVHPANENLQRLVDLLREAGADVTAWEPSRSWMLALTSSLAEVESWIARHLRQ